MRRNLDDPAEREACRRELKPLMRVPRLIGFLLIVIGTAIAVYGRHAGIGRRSSRSAGE